MAGTKSWILGVVVVLLIAGGVDAGKRKKESTARTKPAPRQPNLEEVGIEVIKRPDDCNVKSQIGQTLSIQYVGSLPDGSVFDSSRGLFDFILGSGQVIPGWDIGLRGMCIGESRKLIIPPQFAYGEQGYPGVIPPSATLTFTVELLYIK